jgi:hypothetical protein
MVVWVANNLNANFVLKTGERRADPAPALVDLILCMQGCLSLLPAKTHHSVCCPCHADDDAYVDCERLVADLRSRCRNPDCRNERLYMGEEKRNGDVILDAVSSEPNLHGAEVLPKLLCALHGRCEQSVSQHPESASLLFSLTLTLPAEQQVEQFGVLGAHGPEGVHALHVWGRLHIQRRHRARPAPDKQGRSLQQAVLHV